MEREYGMNKAKVDLRERTRSLALRLVRPFAKLPKTTEAQVFGKQLIARLSPFLLVNWSFAFPRSRQLMQVRLGPALPPTRRDPVAACFYFLR